MLEETQRIHLHTKFHVNVFFVLASGSPKPQFWTNFDIGGLLYRSPFTDEVKFSAACARADPWCTVRAKFRLDRFISVALWQRQNPNFSVFLDLGILWYRQLRDLVTLTFDLLTLVSGHTWRVT